MDDNQKLSASIREGIDACRPGRGDLRLPELEDVARAVIEDEATALHFARVERCDAALKKAMQGVVVPAGLANRLLANMPVVQTVAAVQSAATVEVAAGPPREGRNRRRWLSYSVAAALLVSASLLVAWSLRPERQVDLPRLAEVWQSQLQDAWRPMTRASHAALVSVRLAVNPRGWQPTAAYQGYKGIAYDVSRRGSNAVLFVVNVSPNGALPKFPPLTPQFSSDGKAVAVWLVGKQMCMLVVDGDERAYRSLIQSGQIPVA